MSVLTIAIAALTLLAVGSGPVPASASTNVNLDSFRGDDAEAKAFGPILDSGQQYTVTVVGTYSKWPASQWIDDGVCTGTPENSPMTPSSGATNGKVGLDAEWRFATPVGSSVCNEPAPDTDGSFQISVDGGSSFQNLTADNQGNGPNPAHEYKYTITGQDQIIAFRILDPNSSASNYGKMQITIEAACQNTAVTVWEEASGGNGHSYQAVCSPGANWDSAQAALEATGGHLATMASGAENSFVFNLIDDTNFWSLEGDFCPGPFIGGYQTPGSAEPAEGWAWVTGEPFSYTNWAPDEPGDSDFANENRVAFGLGDCGPDVATAPVWHDVEPDESGVRAFVAEWDVSSVSVEFTQAIQQLQTLDELQADLEGDGKPPVPMIAGKPAAMRVYLAQVAEPTEFNVEVSGVVQRTVTTLVNNSCTPEDRRRQDNGCRSVDFYFTPPSGSWNVTLKVRDADNELLEEHEFHLTSVEADEMVIRGVQVCSNQVSAGNWDQCSTVGDLYNHLDYIRKVMPTAHVRLELTGEVIREQIPVTGSADPAWGRIANQAENLFWAIGGGITLGEQWFYVAAVDPAARGPYGMGREPGRGVAVRTAGTAFNGTINQVPTSDAHELAHNMGVRHTNTPLPDSETAPGCYNFASDAATDWEHVDNYLHSETPEETIEVGFDVVQGKALPGDEYLELMGYCAPRWVSPHTYNGMLATLRSLNQPSAITAGTVAPHWLVRGTIDGQVTFEPLVVLDSLPPAPSEGSHTLQVLGAGDAVLSERTWTPSETQTDLGPGDVEFASLPSFSQPIAVVAGAQAIVVLDPAHQDIGRINLAGASPTVAVDVENSATAVVASWTVSDADSAQHTYWVQYSADGGANWQTLAQDIADTTLTLDPDTLAGADAAFVRVLASDGVNVGTGTSNAFAVEAKSPTATISSPTKSGFGAGQLVWLGGAAIDPDDGSLDDAAVTWSSSRDGNLGNGASLPVYDLSVGQHTITMIAKDSDNNTATDSISIIVFDGPIVEAGAVADIDCSGDVGAPDALALLYYLSGLDSDSCKTIGAGEPVAFGDVDCDGSVDPGDLVAILALVADLPSGCTSTASLRQ